MSGIAGTSARDTEIRLPRATKVKNKQPAGQQVRPICLRAPKQTCRSKLSQRNTQSYLAQDPSCVILSTYSTVSACLPS